MKKILYSFFLVYSSFITLNAQVPKKIVVEHFTNSRCSICASRNPEFYASFNDLENAVHIAFHPSSPYPQCVFNLYNPASNDARANYYGIYGSTPQFVVNGDVITPSSGITQAGAFESYENLLSPASIKIEHQISGQAIQLRVVVYTEAANNGENLRLFAALKEDLVNYAAPNGENTHYDVFRKSWFDIEGQSFVMPSQIGDSVEFVGNISLDSGWNASDFSTIVIVQKEDSKEVIQAEELGLTEMPLTLYETDTKGIQLFPNPANEYVKIENSDETNLQHFQIVDLSGRILETGSFKQKTTLNTTELPSGVYYLFIGNQNNFAVEKLLISH